MSFFRKLLFVCFVICPAIANAAFIEGMSDIPLVDGAKQIHSANISFGNDQSRFDEAYISAKRIDFEKVADFYKGTLPQLGWKILGVQESALHFERESEILDIVLEKRNPLLVRFTLKSKD